MLHPTPRSRAAGGSVVVALAAAAVFACSSFGTAPVPAADGGGDGGPLEAGADDGGEIIIDEGDGGGEGCPRRNDVARMVRIKRGGFPDYCIDATETTVAQYFAWVDAANGAAPPPAGTGARCSSFAGPVGNPEDCYTDYLASGGEDEETARKPIECITYCEAAAYCAWAGKRLCGDASGAAIDSFDETSTRTTEWYGACSRAGVRRYPYGDTYESGRCNGPREVSTGVLPVPTEGCKGAYTGLFDMVGNAAEWENACVGDQCLVRGGDYGEEGIATQECAYGTPQHARDERYRGVTIRCCATPAQ